MDEEIKEKYVNSSPEPVNVEKSEKIIEQMKKCICRIHYNGNDGTGFFIKIPYKSNLLPVLITNNHIIDLKSNDKKKLITIFINEEAKERFIKINDKRLCYTSKELDVTIIEIKKIEDNIKYFLELDDSIINSLNLNEEDISEQLQNIYANKSVYVLNYPEGKNVVVSYGEPPKINKYQIMHKCITKNGSSGSPILLLQTNKVIGVHYGSSSKFGFNRGTVIIYAILDLFNIENKNKKIDNFLLLKNKTFNEQDLKTSIIMKKKEIENSIDSDYSQKNLIIHKESIFNIEYNLNKKTYSGKGFLIQIPIDDHYHKINGLMTSYNLINENIINNNTKINLYSNQQKLTLELDKVFIFSDPFLNITFIETRNSELNYLEVEEKDSDILDKKIYIKKLSNEVGFSDFKGKIKELWGFLLLFNASTKSNLYGSPLLLNSKKVIGIHQFSNEKISYGTNIHTIYKL